VAPTAPAAPAVGDPNATVPGATATDAAAAAAAPAAPGTIQAPTGPGWVIELKGHHFFNDEKNIRVWGGVHVRNTLLKKLREQTIELPTGPGQALETFTMEELGIGFAILAHEPRIDRDNKILNPFYEGRKTGPGSGMSQLSPFGFGPEGGTPTTEPADNGSATAAKKSDNGDDADKTNGETKEDPENPPFYDAPRFDFIVQFCWQEQLLTERLRKHQEQLDSATTVDGASTVENPSTGADSSVATPPPGG